MAEPVPTDIADISAFLPTQNFILDVLTPAGSAMGWKITLCAASHEKAVSFAEAESRRALERAKAIREAQFNGIRYSGDDGRTPDQARRDAVQWVIARILDWTPIKIGGAVYAFSDKTAEDLLIRPELGGVLTQITKALNDDMRFTPGCAKP